MNTTVDIGNNLAGLIAQLAAQIGTTAEQVFPWYVRQQIIEGWTFLAFNLTFFALGVLLVLRFYKHANFDSGKGMAPVVLGGVLIATTMCAAAMGISEAIGKVFNPQFGAMQALSRDIGRMGGK